VGSLDQVAEGIAVEAVKIELDNHYRIFGAQDRCDFGAFLCRAPSAATEPQAVGRPSVPTTIACTIFIRLSPAGLLLEPFHGSIRVVHVYSEVRVAKEINHYCR
jgi:hypothetical protein